MHELSIAISIVELAVEEAKKANAGSVTQVDVEIGTLSGVEQEALLFAWDAATHNTAAMNSRLEIHTIEAEAHCRECGGSFSIDNFFVQCPHCGSFRYDITRGKELKVKSLLVE